MDRGHDLEDLEHRCDENRLREHEEKRRLRGNLIPQLLT